MSFEPEFDPSLWFTMGDCCPGKHYLLYNPHTFPGRMGAWCPVKRVQFCVSKSSIEDCSVEASYWIRGFLAGCEPDAPTDEQGDYLPEDNPAYERWREDIKQFPETGLWILGDRECQRCHGQLLPTNPGQLCSECDKNS